MSTALVNDIQNAAGTAGPSFSKGFSGKTSGVAVATGEIGEVLSATATTAYTTSVANLTSLSITAGVWVLSGLSEAVADASGRLMTMHITATTGGSDGTTANGRLSYNTYDTSQGFGQNKLGEVVINISSTTTYYLTGKMSTIAGLSSSSHRLQARRIS